MTTISDAPVNPRVESLREKHRALSKRIEEARKRISVSDYYLNDLKKQRLLLKERLVSEAERATN